jgi:pimeloyl-ACP methyl ester carboxylesterase
MAVRSVTALPGAPAFEVLAEDGVRLRGHRLGDALDAVVFCHGFAGSATKPRLLAFQRHLARSFSVFAFDFRGHGASEGLSAFGAAEHLDVDAVVGLARRQGCRKVVTVGGSMGGIAVIGQAALRGGIDGVVAISAPARWHGHDSPAVRRMGRLTATSSGRRALRAFGVRVSAGWDWPQDPRDLVARIAPIPLVIVHGRDDHYFDEEEAWSLYHAAGRPKRLLLASRFGHAEDGYTPAFAQRLSSVIREEIA